MAAPWCTSLATTLLCSLIMLYTTFDDVRARARLLEPPMRSSYWREGLPDASVNFYDELLNCGGYEYQWNVANGECGACGDGIKGFRENEYPGKYSQFPPQRAYMSGTQVNITVFTYGNMLGYFRFHICPFRDGPDLPDLSACFQQHLPLTVLETGTDKYYPGSLEGFHDLHVVLPENLTCTHCILQWTYVTGYREHKPTNHCEPCLGCGPQETYINCADIQIYPAGARWQIDIEGGGAKISNATNSSSFDKTTPLVPQKFISYTNSLGEIENPQTAHTLNTTLQLTVGLKIVTESTLSVTSAPIGGKKEVTTSSPNTIPPCTPDSDLVKCSVLGIQRLIPGMSKWCLRTCQSGRCREEFCNCYCQYSQFKIQIDPEVFSFLKAQTKYSFGASMQSSSSLSSSSISSSSTTSSSRMIFNFTTPKPLSKSEKKKLCYRAMHVWSRTPGLNGWCAFNCPSLWCADMCSLQLCTL